MLPKTNNDNVTPRFEVRQTCTSTQNVSIANILAAFVEHVIYPADQIYVINPVHYVCGEISFSVCHILANALQNGVNDLSKDSPISVSINFFLVIFQTILTCRLQKLKRRENELIQLLVCLSIGWVISSCHIFFETENSFSQLLTNSAQTVCLCPSKFCCLFFSADILNQDF